jgi:signal peptidase II
MTLKKAYGIVFLIILLDQISKIYIKTHFMLGEEVRIFDWFRISFVENEGMAMGKKIPGAYGKLLLTLFRIAAVFGIGYWLHDTINKKGNRLLILCIALILAGAIGNIIDSVFYGVLFNHSEFQVATLFSDQPYGTWLQGKVVDMIYFPIWTGHLPEWLPFWGGNYFVFFEYIFNIADTAISCAVILLILFNKTIFDPKK